MWRVAALRWKVKLRGDYFNFVVYDFCILRGSPVLHSTYFANAECIQIDFNIQSRTENRGGVYFQYANIIKHEDAETILYNKPC